VGWVAAVANANAVANAAANVKVDAGVNVKVDAGVNAYAYAYASVQVFHPGKPSGSFSDWDWGIVPVPIGRAVGANGRKHCCCRSNED